MSTQQTDIAAVLSALTAPFTKDEIKFRPGAISGNRALALPYVDARVIMDRLDAVLGAANWSDDYQFLEGGSVLCRLSIRLGDEWVCKADVGGQSEQPDDGDRHKAAVSDALKRAAVKFGIGRYLYRLPQQWTDWDPAKKKWARQPALPATPVRSPAPQSPATPNANGKPAAAPPTAPTATAPTTTAELAARLYVFGERLVVAGLCQRAGELVDFVRGQLGVADGTDPEDWPVAYIEQAMHAAKLFEKGQRHKATVVLHVGSSCRPSTPPIAQRKGPRP
jgi:hypothetical protein